MYLLHGGVPVHRLSSLCEIIPADSGFSQLPALRGIQPEAQWPPTLLSALGQLLGPLSSY